MAPERAYAFLSRGMATCLAARLDVPAHSVENNDNSRESDYSGLTLITVGT
jgi:hypothetical protein